MHGPLHRWSLWVDTGPLCLNPEYSLSCLNDGICQEDDIGNSTFCVCTLPYEGPLCEFNKTFACSPDACKNNGTCMEDPNGISCECVAGMQIKLWHHLSLVPYAPVKKKQGEPIHKRCQSKVWFKGSNFLWSKQLLQALLAVTVRINMNWVWVVVCISGEKLLTSVAKVGITLAQSKLLATATKLYDCC